MFTDLPVLLIAIPFLIAIVNFFLPVFLRKLLTFICLSFLLITIANFYFINGISASVNTSFGLMLGENVFKLTELGLFALVFIQLLSFIIFIFSLKGVEKAAEKWFFVLYPFTISFCNGVILSNNLFSFLIFWGLSGLVLYFFGLLGNTKETPRTAMKTIIIIGGSDALLIFGFVALRFLNPQAGWSLSQFQTPLDGWLPITAFILCVLAAFAKAGGFPMHTWVPDFSKDAPVESAALLPASLDKLLGIYLLAQIMASLFKVTIFYNLVIITFGAITVITAVMMAMNQHNGRRLLGYHAVSQVGYMIIGVGSGHVLAFAGGLFHLINHTIYKSNLFLSLGSVEKQTGTNELKELGGLGNKMPITFLMALIGALSISGIPPFNGFFSKWMIYQGLLDKAKDVSAGYQLWLLACLVLAIFGSALTLASFMKFLHAIFLGKRPKKLDGIHESSFNQWLATGLLSFLCILFGIFAVQIPLKLFIYPALQTSQMAIPQFIGNYNPLFIIVLTSVVFIIGFVVYLLTRKVRYDQIYLGGMPALEKFRVAGTEFYNEIRNMKPLKGIYDAAEKKVFDIYEVGGKAAIGFGKILQKAHSGQLQVYLLYLIIGVLLLIWII